MSDRLKQLLSELRSKWVTAPDGTSADAVIQEALPAMLLEHMGQHIDAPFVEARKLVDDHLLVGQPNPEALIHSIAGLLMVQRTRHDLRERELLSYNSAEMERRRLAERRVRAWELTIGQLGEALYESEMKRQAAAVETIDGISLGRFLADIMAWQHETFGPHQTLEGIRDHMRKEVKEIEDSPADRTEPIDLIMLGISYLRRLGLDAAEVVALWQQRMVALKRRSWPDWRTADLDKAIEHLRAAGSPPEPDLVPVIAYGASLSEGADGPPPQPTEAIYTEATYTTAEIETAFRSYLKHRPSDMKKLPRWHDREWDHFRSGLRARALSRGRK